MWSLDGKKLATRTRKAVRIWSSKDGSLLGTIQASNNNCTIEAIAWTSSSIESSNDQSNGESNKGDDTYDERENKEGNDTTKTDEIKTNPGNKIKIESEKGKKGEPQLLVVEHVYKADQKMAGSTAILRYRHDTNNINNPWSSTSSKIIDHTSVISIGVVDDYRLVAVGVDTGGDPKSETEKFIRLFDFVRGKTMSIAPLPGAPRNISVIVSPEYLIIARKNVVAVLVTYKHQSAYPQLWSIRLTDPYTKHPHTQSTSRHDFVYIQSYFSKETSDFSGRGCFGGLDNSYVCCSSQEGEIFIWDRVTGLLIGTINPASDEHIKFFTCNKQASPEFRCASGAVDGILSLWTANVRNTERTSGFQGPGTANVRNTERTSGFQGTGYTSSPAAVNSLEPDLGGPEPYTRS
ncbi:unnamed protein product [Rhizoctonia solani]|uniref:Uncharacterized protein n=1 Tax=Rhizoctonia solani TaxID=456999 RepID=A0A8H3AMX5_9AGAM|nr:unnamed protein product [Rhizoctonia solani]